MRDAANHIAGQKINAFADRELPPEQCLILLMHLAWCQPCRASWLDTLRLKRLLRDCIRRVPVPVPDSMRRSLSR